jgi:ketosteroid isomerase-like protein
MIGDATIGKSSRNEKGVYTRAIASPGWNFPICRPACRLFAGSGYFIPMFHLRLLLVTLVCLLSGCATAPTSKLTADQPGEKARIQSRLNEIIDAAEKKDFERLDSYHFYGPKFTKFGTAGGRLDAAEARQDEHQGLTKISDLSMRVNDLKIDVFGNSGIATFIMNSDFSSGTNALHQKARSTLVFVNDGGSWKITHEHFSPLKVAP